MIRLVPIGPGRRAAPLLIGCFTLMAGAAELGAFPQDEGPADAPKADGSEQATPATPPTVDPWTAVTVEPPGDAVPPDATVPDAAAPDVAPPDRDSEMGPWVSTADDGDDSATPRYALEKIVIKGNWKTMDRVILRYITITPEEVFSADDPRLQRARYRLLALGLFHDVSLSLKRGSKRGWVILQISVKERNTIVLEDIVVGFSDITPFYGALDVAERSFLGSGLKVSAAAVLSPEQYGYRLRFSDDHFLNSNYRLHAQGLFSHAIDFFGQNSGEYTEMLYDRAGIRLGTGYNLPGEYYLSLDYRFEVINATVPPSGSHETFDEIRPIEFGLLPGHSTLSSLLVGIVRDTRDNPVLASRGQRIAFEIELSNKVVGSGYNFSKFALNYDRHLHLGRQHSLKFSLFGGLIMGDAPFFNRFFVGDFSAFIPSRVLDHNFAHLNSSLLETSIKEMRYEDMAVSVGVEYSIPFYRGHGFFYGINGFVGIGLFALASEEDLSTDPKSYEGYKVIPMDLTMNLGIKVDTEFGIFVFSLANLFRMIPTVGTETTE